ncbi:MAG: hypothetical protein J7L61_02690, partial [Thermoplasmata archaeon]|nr:hypothetical protein [Thermoplasmata archaeon]
MFRDFRISVWAVLLSVCFVLPSLLAVGGNHPGGGMGVDPWAGVYGGDRNVPAGWWKGWMYDKDGDGVDDRLYNSSFPCTVLVDYYRDVEGGDMDRLESLGLRVSYRARLVDTIIARAPSLEAVRRAAFLPGVAVVEADEKKSLFLDVSARAVKARDSSLYPSVWKDLNITGQGINAVVLDTGVDDSRHAAFEGKFVGGADFSSSVVGVLNTNPDDRKGHGTHVGGTLLGTGAALDGDGDGEYDYMG